MNLEFLSYIPTPGEKSLGIASIRYMGKIMLRYRILPRKDGQGYFPASSSLKIKDDFTGADKYIESFMIDSRSDNDEILRFVMSNVNKEMGKTSVIAPNATVPNSVFKDDEIPF